MGNHPKGNTVNFLRKLARFARAFVASTPLILDTRTGRTFPIIAGAADPPAGEPADPPADPPAGEPADPPADPPAGEGDDDDAIDADDDWKTKSRKHENRAKREKAKREAAERRAAELERNAMSEQERAVAEAEARGKESALAEARTERRADRLESTVTRLASRGVKVGEETVRFADTEDALLRVRAALDRGDLDADEVFGDDDRPDADALATHLAEIAEAHPHLTGKPAAPAPGDPDTGKGEPADTSLESMTPADHAKRKYPANAG